MNKMTEPAGFIGFNNNLFERMRDMHRSWHERLREIRQIEAEFGTRLGCNQGDPCTIRWRAWPRSSDNCVLIGRCGGNSLFDGSKEEAAIALITPPTRPKTLVSGAYNPGKHDRSFDAISYQLSDKRFIVNAVDGLITWARTGSMMWLQFGLACCAIELIQVYAAVLARGPRSSVLNEERKQVTMALSLEPARNDAISPHPAVLARYREQLVELQDALSKGINAGDSDATEAIRALVETVTVFRDPSRPGGRHD
jgi:hypothetical protein